MNEGVDITVYICDNFIAIEYFSEDTLYQALLPRFSYTAKASGFRFSCRASDALLYSLDKQVKV